MRGWLTDGVEVPQGVESETLLDRRITLGLTGDGPRYLWSEHVKKSGLFRTVGYTSYDKSFADIFFCEMVRCNGKVTPFICF